MVLYHGWSLFLVVRFIVAHIEYRLREGAFPAAKSAVLRCLVLGAYHIAGSLPALR
jgi:hypothetical protein